MRRVTCDAGLCPLLVGNNFKAGLDRRVAPCVAQLERLGEAQLRTETTCDAFGVDAQTNACASASSPGEGSP